MPQDPLIEALVTAGALPADGTATVDQGRWIVEAARSLAEAGVGSDGIVRLARIGRALARIELDSLVAEVAEGLPADRAVARKAERGEVIARLVRAVRWSAVDAAVERLTGIGDRFQAYTRELVYVPSALFLRHTGLDLMLQQNGGDRLHLAWLCIGLGRFGDAERRLRALPATPEVRASLAIARMFVGRVDAARADADAALAAAPASALVLAFAAVVRAFEAGLSTDVLTAARCVQASLDLIERSRRTEEPDPIRRAEALLARGRVALLMPPQFAAREDGLADLRAVLDLRPPAPPGGVELLRLHAAYFLGMHVADAAEAARLLEEVIVIDPRSTFAERAYRRLSEVSS